MTRPADGQGKLAEWPKDWPQPSACVLCGAYPELIGIWEVSGDAYRQVVVALAAQGFGLPGPGKRRFAVYGLCGPCARRPRSLEEAEERILVGGERRN